MILDEIKNRFDFFIRTKIPFSRKNYKEEVEIFDISVYSEEQKQIIINLSNKYNIPIPQTVNERNFIENIYFLSVFDKYFSKRKAETLSLLDIGSKNWYYAKSEYVFIKSLSENFILNGIELDAYRLNNKFYTRKEISKFYTRDMENTNYIAGDLLKHETNYDYIIWILPFITEYPLIKWGLPLKYFKPEKMLIHAFNRLNKNGELLIINQGEDEYNIQQTLYKKLNIEFELFGELDDKFNLFRNRRFCSKVSK